MARKSPLNPLNVRLPIMVTADQMHRLSDWCDAVGIRSRAEGLRTLLEAALELDWSDLDEDGST